MDESELEDGVVETLEERRDRSSGPGNNRGINTDNVSIPIAKVKFCK